ncbi:hypothetical protein AB1Y20_002982 [Prymnesium parvum]|uniref:RNA helicase n=1 Tax=Prymnesium parvum TaxID=97485 RepID=A0AB34JCR6_PRYPA
MKTKESSAIASPRQKKPKPSPSVSPKPKPPAAKRKRAAANEAKEVREAEEAKEEGVEAAEESDSPATESVDDEPRAKQPRRRAEAASRLAFSNFRLSGGTVEALAARGVVALFPIQAAVFDLIYDGHDVIGRARTGMGKTLAFALPVGERLLEARRREAAAGGGGAGRAPLALVMTPTRELAQQVAGEVSGLFAGVETLCVYGGAPMGAQCDALRRGVDVVVGTPGRIKDLAERGVLGLSRVRYVTLDEADQMLDMGFADDMAEILAKCTAEKRQTCLFSATLPPWVREVAPKYMTTPQVVDLVGDADVKASQDVRHVAIAAPARIRERTATINDVISMYASSTGRVIVFCETKAECDELANAEELKLDVKPLHGDIPQSAREKTMAAFRNGKFRVLVATDVAARGLDMLVELVVMNKPPMKKMSGREDTETYVHRSGRTGRAGRKGVCVTLFGPREKAAMLSIERATKNSFEWLSAPNPRTLLKTAAATAASDAAAVAPEACAFFMDAASSLLEEKRGDALAALSAALALATGTMRAPASRSLLTFADGYVTMRATMRQQVHSCGYVWGALRKVLPDGACEGTESIRCMRLTADGYGAVFDIKEELLADEAVRGALEKPMNDWLAVCEEVPPLLESNWTMGADAGKGGKGKGAHKGGGKGGDSPGKGGKGADSPGKGGKGGKGSGGKGGRGSGWGSFGGGGRGGRGSW